MRLVREVFALADEATARFARASGVTCPTGCGLCCEASSPAIAAAEAEYLARYALARDAPGLATVRDRRGVTARPCPFYDPASHDHCTVYEARPLVCRLFGYAGSTDRDGRRAYRLCRYMTPPARFYGTRGYAYPKSDLPEPADMLSFRLTLPGDDRRAE